MSNATDEIWYAGGPVEGLDRSAGHYSRAGFDWNRDGTFKDHSDSDGFQPDPFTLGLEMQQATGKPAENVEEPVETVENLRETKENGLFSLASDRVGLRATGYGQENSFPAIRRLWNAFLRNRPQSEGGFIDLTDAEVADMMCLLKHARKQVRRVIGGFKRDDNVDCAGYLYWSDRLEKDQLESVDE